MAASWQGQLTELLDTSYHRQRLAKRLEDPEFRAFFEGALAALKEPKHGTHGTYNGGCRCDECRAGQAAYMRGYRAARKSKGGSS